MIIPTSSVTKARHTGILPNVARSQVAAWSLMLLSSDLALARGLCCHAFGQALGLIEPLGPLVELGVELGLLAHRHVDRTIPKAAEAGCGEALVERIGHGHQLPDLRAFG